MRSPVGDALAALEGLLRALGIEGVMKFLAGRGKDIDDARSILLAQRGRLDLERVRRLLADLDEALDRSDLAPAFEALLRSRPRP